MKINMKNKDQIKAALNDSQGRRKSFVLDYDDLVTITERAEDKISEIGIPVNHRARAEVTFRMAGPSAKSYKYTATVTVVTLTRGSQEWFLTNITTSDVYPATREVCDLKLTEPQKLMAVEKFKKELAWA